MPRAPLISITAEVDKYLAEADALKYGDRQRLLDVAQEAASRAQTLGDFRRYALALNHQAWAYANLNQYEPSLTHALEALVMARGHGYMDIEARAVNIIAMNFIHCGIVHEAMRLYEYQIELGERLNDGAIQSMGLHDLALVRLGEREFEAAVGLIEKSLDVLPPDFDCPLDVSVTHGNLALALCEAGRLDEALAHARKALQLAQKAESVSIVGHTHIILGTVVLARANVEEASRQINLARDCVETGAPNSLSANIEELAARILTREGDDEGAIQAWERAYDIAFRGQMVEFAVTLLNNAKDAYQRAGNMAGVVSAYERLTNDIPRLQKQDSELRFTVVRMVFAMDKAAAQAEIQLTKQKNAILQRISHEFRTPLTIIQTTADLVERYGDRLTLEQRQERLGRITGQVKWMTVMLEDIVELLGLDDANQMPLPKLSFRLDDLATGIMSGLDRYRTPKAIVRVEVQPDAGLITGAQQTLETVAVHLLTNAIKFSRDEVVLALSVESGTLVMCVADQGIGIPPEEQAAIFQPLVRGTNLNEVGGAGLGLAIVAKLVERIGGTIELSSLEGKGTTVTVRVPSWKSEGK